MNIASQNLDLDTSEQLLSVFDAQRGAYLIDPEPDYKQRLSDLKNLKQLIIDHQEAIIDAISEDYGSRSRHQTLFAEIIPVLDDISSNAKHLRKWMRVKRRSVDMMMFPGAKNRLKPQPLGVVGLIIPWNFPINLCFSQISVAFAAGNRVMAKMSENSVALSRLLMKVSGDYFPPEKLTFLEETGGVGIEFSKIPFDMIVFTGSGQTGRAVMASAAQNLTPVVLELGGKAPAVIDPNFPLKKAVERIMFVKQFNSGQICTNVDYVFVHESQREAFIEEAKAYVAKSCPDIEHVDYTAIIDDRSVKRLSDTLDDAGSKGATIVNLCGEQQINVETKKVPMYIVADTTSDMTLRQRETFGPILMLLTYNDSDEVIEYVNGQDRPLAFYPFSNDKKLVEKYISRIMSGGVSVNDGLLHVVQHDLPFGGVGPSGMGHYHGYEGFVALSKMRPIFYQAGFSALKYLAPPYGSFATKSLDFLVKMKK
ncbi:MAG: coniferyl-aldehyde dehydrogenase [Arenicella sp.]|jgi:coniferyl-aldehyde dehydrogenase